jgi:hypothetical protein
VFGDSHAQNWDPALEQLALIHGWRVLNLTHAGCPAVATAVWSFPLKREYTECDGWRAAAFARWTVEQPAVILIADAGGYALSTAGGRLDKKVEAMAQWADLWSKGLVKTLARLTPLHSTLVVMGDVPSSSYGGSGPLTCIAQHATDLQTCRTSRDVAVPTAFLDLERSIATSHGVAFVDPTSWLCDATNCPAVVARYVVYADEFAHFTAPFARSLAGRLLAAVPFPK